jgi:hypothetical protein
VDLSEIWRRSNDHRIEWITREAKLVGQKDLLGCEFERLVRGIAEQIVEKRANASPQVDACRPFNHVTLSISNVTEMARLAII